MPANLRLTLRLAKGTTLPPQVTVAGTVRRNTRTTFDVVVAAVNKRAGGAPRATSRRAAEDTVIVEALNRAVDLELERYEAARGRTLRDILTLPPAQQAQWDPIWKAAADDVARGLPLFLDRGQAEEQSPRAYLEIVIEIGLEISVDGAPDKASAFDILGEINELYVITTEDLGCNVRIERNRFFSNIVDIYAIGCKEPIAGFAVVFPDVKPNAVQFAPVVMFTPPPTQRLDLTPGCKFIANSIDALECPVVGFKTTYDIAAGFTGSVASGTPFSVFACRDDERYESFSAKVPA